MRSQRLPINSYSPHDGDCNREPTIALSPTSEHVCNGSTATRSLAPFLLRNVWPRTLALTSKLLLNCCLLFAGCGTTKSYVATEQLLLSDAIDTTIEGLDFTPLAGRKVYLDTSQVTTVRPQTGMGLVNSSYLISAVRERMLLAGCYMSAERENAELVAELRVGAMGTDGHSITYGLPSTNGASSSLMGGNAMLPSLPELSVAKRETMSGAAKVAVFAYERESRRAVWQSGLAQSTSGASDTWVLGAGPIQRGSIHEQTHFAGQKLSRQRSVTSSVEADQAKHRSPPTMEVRAASRIAEKSKAKQR